MSQFLHLIALSEQQFPHLLIELNLVWPSKREAIQELIALVWYDEDPDSIERVC